MQNLDLFDEYVARILAELLERFPVKRAIDARQLCGHTDINDFGVPLDRQGRPSASFDVAMATIEWLADNGYVRAGDRWDYGWRDAVLTPLALTLLQATPDSLSGKEGYGPRIIRFLREGSMDMAKEAAKAVIALGIGRALP